MITLIKKGLKRESVFLIIVCIFAVALTGETYAQNQSNNTQDSIKLAYPFKDSPLLDLNPKTGIFLPNPSNIKRSVEFDPVTKQYIIREKIGVWQYRPPQYFSIAEYQKYENAMVEKDYWQQLAGLQLGNASKPGFIPQIIVDNHSFERIFGSSVIDIRPQGSAELTLAGRLSSNQNPLFNERQRHQGNFDFNQTIRMNVVGQVGDKLRISTNYNTEAQFDFENQVKLDYTGRPDEIIQKIEAGNVSLPLSSTLIPGSQALFGLKTQLQFGRLNVTSIFSQQKSQQREITIANGSQQEDFQTSADNYEANKHYFLAQYFRNNYNRALANSPFISTNINITKIEVWITNRSNSTLDSRDVLAFMDLGENQPYNTVQIQGGFSALPAGFSGPGFPQRSNNLLQNLPAGARFTNSNIINTYFQANGGTDNYSKLTYARKLTDREFTVHPKLGYISLNSSLNADEVLAVAYRYTIDGFEYQVGEFTTDIPVDPNNPSLLFVKLLKNETLKTNLPTWKLMMKNIYSLGAYQISKNDFNLQITRLDDNSGIENTLITEGLNTNGKLWIQLTNLDNLNQQNDRKPDGFFDFLEGVTIDALNGRVTFPLLEPFGSDLAKQFNPVSEQNLIRKYVYQPLYDSTKVSAQQLFPGLNRYIIKGTYQSSGSSSEYSLNAINVPPGSVQISAGTLPLIEGADFTVDYNIGRVRILNQSILNSGQQIHIKMENSELFGFLQRSLMASRFNYYVSNKLNLGGTFMTLTEKPLTQKVSITEEPISNTIWGVDANYSSSSRFLTKLVDRIPFLNTKEISQFTFSGEYAYLNPGHPKALNFAGSRNGSSYLDDFEGSSSTIDIKSAISWQISGTPQLFPESRSNAIDYGYNRSRLSFYNLDPIFFNRDNSLTPPNIRNNRNELSNHYVREVLEQEVFPFKQSSTGQILPLSTLDLAYYPMARGPYNFTTTGISNNGSFLNPRNKWGGIFRKIETPDFDALNIEFIEVWMLDPFIYKPTSPGGDLYFNLGSIPEDILRDGRKSLENGLPPDGDPTRTDQTIWGNVPKLPPVVQAFDNNPTARKFQDIGLDGISDTEERQKFAPFLTQITGQLNAQAAAGLTADPASDNYQYYRGDKLDNLNAGVLKRYEFYNGTEGNSKTSEQSLAETGLSNTASTSLPDGEDINRDNNSSQADEYFQYKVSIRPQDLVVGQNFITDKVTSSVKLANGSNQQISWYQFKIPIAQFQSKAGNIQDFKSIRFMRMFLTDFTDTVVLRMAKLQLVRGEWRRFNAENTASKVLADRALGINPGFDNSTLDVTAVNIEENGTRTPIPYVVPPGIERERNYSNFRGDTRQNEQSLAVNVKNLRDGYARAAFKTTRNDFRSYRTIEMFIHAEGDQLKDNDVRAFIRIGTDNLDNYYEYEIPLKVTNPGSRDPSLIWPDINKMNIQLNKFQLAKTARNIAKLPNGLPWPVNVPFKYIDGLNTITITGQPDLSKVRMYMLGVRNPLRNPANPNIDDGLNKSAQIWFNELRLTDFDEHGGMAANARINAKLADFGDLTISKSNSTYGFGSIDRRVSELNRTNNGVFDISSSFELGKFFDQTGLKIPMFVNFSTQINTPRYDPRTPDIELKPLLRVSSPSQRDSIRAAAEDYTTRKSINFTNVQKIKLNPASKNHFWDIENWNTTYAFTEYNHRDFINESSIQKTYRAALDYNYSTQPNFISPFAKIIKSNSAALFRDLNFNLVPSSLHFRIDVDRLYSENTLRNNDLNNFIPIRTTFNKNFLMNRLYGVSWDLTKSLKINFNATNFSVIDEPDGRVNGLVRDSIWENMKRLGRTTDYGHELNLSYTLPINKIPGLDWINVLANYRANFNWRAEPLLTLRDPGINLGNIIQNGREIQLNPTLNFVSLYNKFGFMRSSADTSTNSLTRGLITILSSIRNIGGSYSRKEGIFMPGYLPRTDAFGYDFDANAPGLDFVFGNQQDIRGRAISNGWVTRDSLLNQLYFTTLREDLNFRSMIEPFRDLRIDLTIKKSRNLNYSSNFKFSPLNNGFQSFSPVTTGDYSISFLALRTAFRKQSGNLFDQFENNRAIISRRLGTLNPNSAGVPPTPGGYADGYNKSSQDVVIASFLAAYTGKDAEKISLSRFPRFPLPNWTINYDGLTRFSFFNNMFADVKLLHTYRSTYSVNGFNSLVRYQELNGFSNVKDVNNNFLPSLQFAQVILIEEFSPLLGVDMRMKNNMSMSFEYRRSRLLGFSLSNSQLAQQGDNALVLGIGYRTSSFRFPFGMFKGLKLDNDLNFKMDLAINDRKTLIHRADVATAEVSSGAKNITFRPSVDYVLDRQFNLRLFYDGNITKPYTSQTFNTSFSNFGVSLRFTLQ